MVKRLQLVLIVVSTITLLAATVYSAEMTETELTPTPASLTDTPSTSGTSKLLSPKTQADLSIVTGNIQRPNGIIWYDHKLYTVCSGDWTLYEIDPTTGTTIQYIYGVKNAHTLYATTKDNKLSLWIPDFQNNTLVNVYEGTSQIVASKLQGPWGITSVDDQSFVVTNLSANNAMIITSDGITKEIISNLRSPTGIVSDKDYIYIANTGSTRRAIEWFEKSTISTDPEQDPLDSSKLGEPLITGLQNVTNLTIGPDDMLYFSYSLGTRGVVGRVDPAVCQANGGCTSDMVEIVLYTELPAPLAGLSITPDMQLYIHSIFSPEIYWVQLESDTTTQ